MMTILDLLFAEHTKLIQAHDKPYTEPFEYFDHEKLRAAGLLDAFLSAYNAFDLSDADWEKGIEPFKPYVSKAIRVINASDGGIGYMGTGDFASLYFETVKMLDAYGSQFCRLKPDLRDRCRAEYPDWADRLYILLETYGDEDDERHDEKLVYTPCLLALSADETTIEAIEVADFAVTDSGEFVMKNRFRQAQHAYPKYLVEAFHHEDLCGKRALYVDVENAKLSIRCSETFYMEAQPYQDPSRPPGNPNLSGTRILLPLIPA